ncbi:hypothetical protein C474_13634 [Halogeometricum pallidum JCM 14848]|uniref:Uncharacterized protein n=1 Tax=Halogeometricum pallidum JCM 14848 TaxID=1227487 RepID=M0D2N3_HALPD|nr:hypothetical protein C474_13634 [Halogeometricum pallidum JCM 14848]
MVRFENGLVLQQELLVNERLCGWRQAVFFEDCDLFVDEVTYLHTTQCGETIDYRVPDPSDVLLERLVPAVPLDAFEFDRFDELLHILVQRFRILWLVIEILLC